MSDQQKLDLYMPLTDPVDAEFCPACKARLNEEGVCKAMDDEARKYEKENPGLSKALRSFGKRSQ